MHEALKDFCSIAEQDTPLNRLWQEWLENTTPYFKTHYIEQKPYTYEFRRYGDAIALLEPKGDYLLISKLEALEPGRGAGKKLVEFLVRLADKYQMRLYARAVAYKPDPPVTSARLLSQEDLQAWYARLGFQVWQINKDSADIGYPDLPAA